MMTAITILRVMGSNPIQWTSINALIGGRWWKSYYDHQAQWKPLADGKMAMLMPNKGVCVYNPKPKGW